MIQDGADTPKKSAARKGGVLAKSASESSLKKRQEGSLLDQELLVLERDEGKRHARQLSNTLLEYAKKIEEVQAKNRRLEEELSFDDHVAREDPFYNEDAAEKLSTLYLQGNNFMIRLELERKEIARLNAIIQRSEATLALQKTKLYELSALDHNHTVLVGKIRKMEHDIDRRIVKMNEKLSVNRRLREAIDAQRAERARMDSIYTKIATEVLAKRSKVAKLNDQVDKMRDEVAGIEQEIEEIRKDGDDWEVQCDQRAAVVLQELKEIALQQRDTEELVDADKYKFLGDNELVKHMNAAQENVLRSRVSRSRWKTGQTKISTDALLTKYQENRSFIEKIHEVSGTHTVSEMIDAFNNQEVEHFERIQHVNQLAEDIENHRQISARLRDEIGKLKQRKDSVDFQRMNRIESLKARLQVAIDQKKHKEESNHELQAFLAALKPSILMLHSGIGCPEIHNDSDMKKILGDVEDQIVSTLQKYSTKMEAKQNKESPEATNGDAPTSGSPTRDSNQSASPDKPGAGSPPNRKQSSHPVLSSRPRAQHSAGRRASGTGINGSSKLDASADASTSALPPPLSLIPSADQQSTLHGSPESKATNGRAITALLSKEQPYRYVGLKPPHLSVEELKKKDNVEEEYPLTYDELKVKVWRSENGHPGQ